MSKITLAVLSMAAGLAFSAVPSAAAPVSAVKTMAAAEGVNVIHVGRKYVRKRVTIRRGRRCTVRRVVTRRYGRRVVRVVRRCRW